jgi:acyl-coenzyme A synthetase/AMP-(fatty) acid ligase
MYGPTETTIWSSVHPVAFGGHQVPIGRPIDNTTMHIVDAKLEPVPVGVVGELMIGGRGLARGYHKRADLTAQKFVKDPFSQEEGARLYRTGDLARRLSNGELVCLGRADFQVKIRGFRIELGEIEAALLAHPDVKNTAVVAKDFDREKRLVAYVEARRRIGDDALREHLEQRLPSYMIPARFVEMDALPLTPNGKVDRKMLLPPAKSR